MDLTIASTTLGAYNSIVVPDSFQDQPAKISSLADEYKMKQQMLDQRLKQEIENHQIAKVYPSSIKKQYPSEKPITLKKSDIKGVHLSSNMKQEAQKQYETLKPSPFQQNEQLLNLPFEEKPSQFVRSQRSIAMRIKDTYDNQLSVMESDKLSLIKKLNDNLVQLDKLNQEKAQLSNNLIELIKFVRDMSRETQKCDVDLYGVVNDTLKDDLKHEKEMSHQMKEELKRSEMERMRILNKVNELEQLRDELELQQSEMRIQLEQKSRMLDDVNQDFRDALERIERCQNESDHCRAVVISNREAMNKLENEIEGVMGERKNANEKLQVLQDRFDAAVQTFSRERQEIDNMHDRHLKLLSANLMVESLQKIVKKRVTVDFQLLRTVLNDEEDQKKGLIQMRKVFKKNKARRLRKYLNKWYLNALKPMNTRKQKTQVSIVIQRKNPISFAFYKWQNAFEVSIRKKHIQRQIIAQMLMSKDNFHDRVMKNYLMRWRDLIRLKDEHKRKAIKNYLLKRHQKYLTNFFNRWRAISLELDFQIKMHGMSQRLAHRNYQSAVFASWRHVTADLKNKRLSILLRYWKNFKIYVLSRKQLRCQALTILRERKTMEKNLVKACFDELRLNKEQEKYVKIDHTLNQVEIPRREQALEMIKKVSGIDDERYKKQAIQALSKCFGKVVFKYFKRWSEATQEKERILQVDLKQRIIQRYFMILRDAFTKWIAYKGEFLIQMQSEIIQQQEEEINAITSDIVEAQHDIEERQQRQKCQSSKQMKKIFMTAFQRQLRERFNQWRSNQNYRIQIQDSAQHILKKLARRFKRLAFNQYKAKVELVKQEILFEKRVSEIRFKLTERQKHRIFKAIQYFSQCHLKSKNYLRRLLFRLDLGLKQSSFHKWQKFQQHKNEKELKNLQNLRVEEIKQQTEQIGDLADQLTEMSICNKTMQQKLNSNGQKIIRLAFQRCFQQSQQTYFYEWLSKVHFKKKMNAQLKQYIIHLSKGSIEQAFLKWKTNISQQQQMVLMECIDDQDSQIQNVQNQIDSIDRKQKIVTEDCQTSIDREKLEQQFFMRKHGNCLKAIINRVDNKIHILRERHILQKWRAYLRNRKLCLDLLQKAIKKTLWQDAFQEIKNFSREVKESIIQEKSTTLLFKRFYRVKVRQAFQVWLKQSKNCVLMTDEQAQVEINLISTNHQKACKVIKDRIQSQLLENRQYLTLFDCYVSWKNHIQQKRLTKTKIQQYQTWQTQCKHESAITHWKQRWQVTKKFRHVRAKIDRVYDRNLVQNVFQGWRYRKDFEKRLCQTLLNLEQQVNKVFVKRSFDNLKSVGFVESFKRQQNKAKGCTFIFDALSNIYQLRMKNTLNTLNLCSLESNKRLLAKKSIIKYWLTNKMRSYLQTWREEAQRREVVRYNSEEGPVAVENHILKKVIFNLKKACEEDGIENERVQEIIETNRRQGLRAIEKGVCRLFCYNEELYLLPKTLDRWRQWVKLRKLFKYWLNYLNNRVDSGKADIQYAFNKWKNLDSEKQKELEGMKFGDLQSMSVQQVAKMHDIAQNLEYQVDTIEDLTEQRDHLLQRYVGSQKLALATSNASCDRAKQKALSKWMSNYYDYNASFYEDALKQNLQRIAALKDRIKHLERSNDQLADQNEELRIGALDGIEMAKSVDDLTREREKLSIDLADKAITIRKLLEDNHNLSVRLNNAQEEAHQLIRMSQIKLQQSSQRGYEGNFENY